MYTHTPVVRLAFHCDRSNEDDTRFVLVDFCDFDRLYRSIFFLLSVDRIDGQS